MIHPEVGSLPNGRKIYADWDYIEGTNSNTSIHLVDKNYNHICSIEVDKLAPIFKEVINDRYLSFRHDINTAKYYKKPVTNEQTELLKLYESIFDKHSK